MSDAFSERRKHARRQCFFITSERERIPVWVFAPPDDPDSHVGLILDLSESGVRVLTAPDHPLETHLYALNLLVESADGPGDQLSCTVSRAWSERDGSLGLVSGLQFEDGTEAAAAFIAANPPSAKNRSWVRCTLRPLATPR
jgi:hypothetical protein